MANRIAPLSNLLYWVCTIAAYALPLFIIAFILRGWFDPALLVAQYPILPTDVRVTPFQATLVAAVAVVATYPLVATSGTIAVAKSCPMPVRRISCA
jgi:hypothetical protein